MLQIKKTGRSEYGQYAKILVYGEPGSGKTLFGSTAKKPLFLNLEGGMMTLADRGIDHVDILEVTDLQEVLLFLRNKDQHEYDTVVIDTLDELQKVLMADRLKKERHESMQLQDWGYVGEQMEKALRAYRNLPMNVIFLCHSKTESDAESGVMLWKPMLQGAIQDKVAGFVDLSTYLSALPVKVGEETEIKRVLRFQASPRYPHIKDRSGKMPPFYELNLLSDFQDVLELIFKNSSSIAESETVGSVETAADRVPSAAQTLPIPDPKPATKKAMAVKAEEKTPFDPPPLKTVKVKKVAEETAFDTAVADVKEQLGGKVVAVKKWPTCSSCDTVVDDEDLIDVTTIRFRKVLCKPHFDEERKKKNTA